MSSFVRRVVAAVVPPLLILAPCLLRPVRLWHPSPWALALAAFVVFVTQPTPSGKELASSADKRSAVAILLGSNLVTLTPLIEFLVRTELQPPPLSWPALVGIVILFAGVVLRVWAIRTLATAFTAVVQTTADQQLIERGPYRWLRHPSYTGVMVSFLGSALAFWSLAGFVAAIVVMLPIYRFRIGIEEAALTARFGDAYRAFSKRRWALVPGLW